MKGFSNELGKTGIIMKNLVKPLWLITCLIVTASMILLMSDRGQRIGNSSKKTACPSIAVMQISSTTLLESHVAGIIDRLDKMGFRSPDGKNIRLYNPQGDFSTANAMARELANGMPAIVKACDQKGVPIIAEDIVLMGTETIILSADNLTVTGFSVIQKISSGTRIPVFVTEIELIKKGADGGVGDSYYEWGKQTGRMAVRILAGVPPSELPIEPTQYQRTVEPESKKASYRTDPLKLRIVLYSETEFAERCRDGLIDGIKRAGYQEGKDYNLIMYNAQGDMSTLSSIMTTVKSDNVDLLMVVSTPTLQAAIRQAGEDTKIVFTGVGDGVRAGAGKSEMDHLPNVTGISTRSPFDGMARIISETIPETRRVGTLFTPGEINSVLYKDWFKEALDKRGIELIAVPVSSSADVAQGAAELVGKNIQVVAQVVDNLTRPGFALIARKAMEKNLPVYVFDSDQMKHGGTICLARDYYDAGLEAAEKAVRILQGENPKAIPFNNTQSEKLIINPELAERYGLVLSDELKKKADIYIPK